MTSRTRDQNFGSNINITSQTRLTISQVIATYFFLRSASVFF